MIAIVASLIDFLYNSNITLYGLFCVHSAAYFITLL